MEVYLSRNHTAANGQKIPGTILYTDETGDKTNYLPLRKISEFLGVEVSYDSATQTIYLGKQPDKSTAEPEPEVIDLRIPETVPENPLKGGQELIKSRGGTILPDDDPSSYRSNKKMFIDKNGLFRPEYLAGNYEALGELEKKAADKLSGLSKEECPHEYTYFLYDQEGAVLRKEKDSCQDHLEDKSIEYIQQAMIEGRLW